MAVTVKNPQAPASDAQLAFLHNLLDRPAVRSHDAYAAAVRYVDMNQPLNKGTASMIIDRLVEMERETGRNTPPPATDSLESCLGQLPTGRYAVEVDGTRLFYRVDNVEGGNWDGWTFVKTGDDQGRKVAAIRPGGTLRWADRTPDTITRHTAGLTAVVADGEAAAINYGRWTGSCAICGRKLTDENSVERGIGPVCASRFA